MNTPKLVIDGPTEPTTLATNITIVKAAQLVVEYVNEHDIHSDIDATYIDENGHEHQFDFESETFN